MAAGLAPHRPGRPWTPQCCRARTCSLHCIRCFLCCVLPSTRCQLQQRTLGPSSPVQRGCCSAARLARRSGPVRQQRLSTALDEAERDALLSEADGEARRAHLRVLQEPGAGAWLSARPAEALGLWLEPHSFRTLLRLRLRLPVATTEGYCPLCDGVADRFGDHALVCPCGGDRVKRHNRLRSTLAARAEAAGLSPEVEKPGLLPARPTELGFCEAGTSATAQARRPADVYIPQWGLRGPAAFDLAVTSGLRGDVLAASAADGSRASAAYEARKRSHQHTEAQCDAQGLQFVPLVAEACGGGWGKTAMITWRTLGSLISARTGESTSIVIEQLLQSLSVSLQRENARAVLRRLPTAAAALPGLPEP